MKNKLTSVISVTALAVALAATAFAQVTLSPPKQAASTTTSAEPAGTDSNTELAAIKKQLQKISDKLDALDVNEKLDKIERELSQVKETVEHIDRK